MNEGNDLEQLRNKLKNVIHGHGATRGDSAKQRAQRIALSEGKLKTADSKSSNDKLALLKEIDSLNLKLLTLQKVFDSEKRRFVESKLSYDRRVKEADERASMYKNKVMIANERINDLEGTLELKNERISSLMAELRILKQATRVDLDRDMKNINHALDDYRSEEPSRLDRSGELINEIDDSSRVVDLDTTKLMKLNLKTFEFDENLKEDPDSLMGIPSHRRGAIEEEIIDDTSISSDSVFTEELLKVHDYPHFSKHGKHDAPIYNSNPITRALASDEDLYLKPLQSRKHHARPRSFNFESALEDSTERIAGL